MHRTCLSVVVMIALTCIVSPAMGQSNEDRKVEDGGIFVPGWMASSDS